LGKWNGASVVAFFPREGRTHQIRVHAEAAGFPLLGDHQYGDRAANRVLKAGAGLSRQALHAWRVAFRWNGAPLRIEAPPPDDWRRAGEAVVPGWEASLPRVD
jgi:23S rRNA-/tRNA-specific pseudouridylate synthase